MEMMERMRLPDGDNIMNSYPFQLSGGMRQRVGIAMAMTFQPKLLLADEPTSALDVTTQAQIVRQMMELRDEYGTSIIMVTHNLGVAAYMSDQIVVMKEGQIVDRGGRDQILRAAAVCTRRSFWMRFLLWEVCVMFDEKDLLLETRHVTRRFPAPGGRVLTACNDVSLKFYKGKTLGLIGESGCGKSTFMRLVVRLDKPTEGEILFKGKNLTKMRGEELRQTRQHIQMVFQDPGGVI